MKVQKELVVKRNELIEGRYQLSAMAQKVAAALISRVNPHDSSLPKFKVTRKEAIELLCIDNNQYRRNMDKVTTELGKILITLDDGKKETKINMFLKSIYEKSDGSVTFEFHPDVEPYIRDFQLNFTQYQLSQIRELKSKYAIRLYEILRRRHPIHCDRAVSFYQIDINDLREMLGVEPNKYQVISNFKRKVIIVAAEELEEKTDLKFEAEYIRNGRKVGAIKFTIKHNEKFEALGDDEALSAEILPENYDEAVAAMLASAVPELPKDVVTLLASRLDAVAASQAFLSYTKAKQAGKVKDPAAYFLGILKHQEQQTKNSQEVDLDDTSWANRADFDEF
ncbi:replication initiation protein [Zooshikella ganghwensis]|uniref:replication initiation protein n=1 Tax=Zooshikella ganghwensis TaxID=202772 RepID=UPI0013FDC2F8|nr:replication initiation protein [Zooshikella ganghwensis]